MSKLIAIFNQKGGVGKTTTNINLATCLATNKKRVLVIDIDPQGNTTSGLGIEKNKLDNTIYELLTDEKVNAKDVIIPTGIKNMDIIPSNVELAGVINGAALSRARNELSVSAEDLCALQVPDLGEMVLAAAPGSGMEVNYARVRDALMELMREAAARLVETADAIAAFESDMETTDAQIEGHGRGLLQSIGGER